jgi:hypothetical protein
MDIDRFPIRHLFRRTHFDPITWLSAILFSQPGSFTYSDPSGYDPLHDAEAAWGKFVKNVTGGGDEKGRQSGGISQRNLEGIKKDQTGELKGFNHAQKMQDALNGVLNHFNKAIKGGYDGIAQKAADTYNGAIQSLKSLGVNVDKALTGPRGGTGTNIKLPEEISPAMGPVRPVEIPDIPIWIP